MSLTIEHINKSFAHVEAIKDLSMEVQEGAIFGFLGANGAGKTTTMRMILDILRPDSGAGSVAGLNDTALAAYIGTALNGTTGTQTAGNPAFALTFSTANALPDLQNQLKNGKLDILLVLARATNQDLRFTYDTSASATNDTNLPTIQGLTQLLTFLDTAHRLGLTSDQTQRLSAAPDVTVVYTQQSQNTRPDSELTAVILLAS